MNALDQTSNRFKKLLPTKGRPHMNHSSPSLQTKPVQVICSTL